MLDREEYVEQAHFFRTLGERLPENLPMQDLLVQVKQEILSTTRLPMAIDFLLAELRHAGTISTAMARLGHYFTPFQTYVVQEAELERGRFDMRIALAILQHEADLRSKDPPRPALFMFQFECLCRNHLRYDPGFTAMSKDPAYDEAWRQWILTVRAQIGLVDFADLIYVRSAYYLVQRSRPGQPAAEPEAAVLFGEKEGKIAWANRRKDPLYLFAALQRQLGYPQVPRPKRPDESRNVLPLLLVRMDRVETRLKMMEEESRRGAVDLKKFYGPDSKLPAVPPPDDLMLE